MMDTPVKKTGSELAELRTQAVLAEESKPVIVSGRHSIFV